MDFQNQLENLATKDRLRGMVDKLEDGDQLIIIKRAANGPDWFYTFGQPSNERVAYIALKFLMQWVLPKHLGGVSDAE